jgi:hypothetical protein
VGPRVILDTVVKRKIPSPHRESNPRTQIVQPARKIHFEESKSNLPTHIDESELYDNNGSYDGDYFTDRDACLI